MQRHRFYAQPASISELTITLEADEAHHLARVLRLAPGDPAFVFDGEGNEFECEVTRAGKSETALKIVRCLEDTVESPLRLTLAQALVKGDKFDLVVQKATELGVTRIIPLITEHADVRIKEGRGDKRIAGHRTERWRRIALEAIKQSGRRRLVEIDEPITFTDFCHDETHNTSLLFSEHSGLTLRELPRPVEAAVNLLIGPEGGWSDNELQLAASTGVTLVHLGPRILRTETAGIAAVALAQHLWGDIA